MVKCSLEEKMREKHDLLFSDKTLKFPSNHAEGLDTAAMVDRNVPHLFTTFALVLM